MLLRSKAIQGMNSSIVKFFEPKFSIFTLLQHASYSRILHIMLIFCCKVTQKKATNSMTKKMQISFFTFVLLISKTMSPFQTQTSLKCFPRHYLLFAHFFHKNFQNPQIILRKTRIKHLKQLTFFPQFASKVFNFSSKARFF